MSEERLIRLGYKIHLIREVKIILPPYLLIPGGSFFIGSDPQKDTERYNDEQPQHQVNTNGFFLAKYPVTVAEYNCAVEAGGVSKPEPQVIAFGKNASDPNHPLPIFLTWDDQLVHPDFPVRALDSWFEAFKYTQWLTDLTEQPWRMPTEVEWEIAAKGIDNRLYPWGNEWEPDRVQSRWNQEAVWDIGPIGTHPQGASPYGVEDMSGNVSEWTSSLYRPYP